MPFWLHVG